MLRSGLRGWEYRGIGARKRRWPMAWTRGTNGTGGADAGGDVGGGAADGEDTGELEIEITDLWTGETLERTLSRASDTRRPPLAARAAPYDDDGDEGEDGDDAAGGEPLPRNGSLDHVRQRRARAALIVTAFALALLVVLVSNPGATRALQTDIFPPTPTLAPGADTVWLYNVVPWGKLTIDGHAKPTPDSATALSLARGQHSLVYEAAPFRTLRCTFSVPQASSDTCPLANNDQNQPNPRPANERGFDLGTTPEKLPDISRMELLAGLQRQLDGFTTTTQLAPGDHYGTPDGTVQVAQQPMSVTLEYVVAPANPSGPSMNFNGVGCNPLCVVPTGTSSYITGWPVSALVSPQWRYTDDSGAPQIVSQAVTGVAQGGGPGGNLLTFSVQWTGSGWKVALPQINNYNALNEAGSGECSVAMGMLPPMADSSGSSNGYSIQTGQNPAGSPLADGCVFAVTPMDGNGTSSGPSALLLLRCGALIAGNDMARKLFPTLPVADAHEAALAQQFGSGLGQP